MLFLLFDSLVLTNCSQGALLRNAGWDFSTRESQTPGNLLSSNAFLLGERKLDSSYEQGSIKATSDRGDNRWMPSAHLDTSRDVPLKNSTENDYDRRREKHFGSVCFLFRVFLLFICWSSIFSIFRSLVFGGIFFCRTICLWVIQGQWLYVLLQRPRSTHHLTIILWYSSQWVIHPISFSFLVDIKFPVLLLKVDQQIHIFRGCVAKRNCCYSWSVRWISHSSSFEVQIRKSRKSFKFFSWRQCT